MGEGGISTQRRHAPTWLRLEGLFCTALLVPAQGAPAILDLRDKVDEKRVARLCVAVARSNAFLTAWQALALALVEPELREAIADSEEVGKLDAILANAPRLAAWFEPPMRSAAATELRAMIDNAVVLPAVQSAMLSQWFDKPVARLAALASEHLALQLEAHGMHALPFVLGLPSSPAFRELAAQSSAQLRRLSASLVESSMRQPAPPLIDRWIADLYTEARHLGRARSDVVPRGDVGPRSDAPESRVRAAEGLRRSGEVVRIAPLRSPSIAMSDQRTDEPAFGDGVSENEVRETIAERAIDEEWISLADLRASSVAAPSTELRVSLDDAPRAESRDDARRAEMPATVSPIALIPPRSDNDVTVLEMRASRVGRADESVLDRAAPSSPSESAEAFLQTTTAREPAVPRRQRRVSVHWGWATFAGALAGAMAVATFMVLADRDGRRPAPVAVASVPASTNVPAAAGDPLAMPASTEEPLAVVAPTGDPLAVVAPPEEPRAVVAPVAMENASAPASTAAENAAAGPIEHGRELESASPASRALAVTPLGAPAPGEVAAPAVTPNAPTSPNSRSCDLALMYTQRGEIAQAIRRFENCLTTERELVRQRIGERGAMDVRAHAEKGQCDQAAAIVAQVESVDAAGAAKSAFASSCASRVRENETAGP